MLKLTHKFVISGSFRNELDQIHFFLLGYALDVERQLSAEGRRHGDVELGKAGVCAFDSEADSLVDEMNTFALNADDLNLGRIIAETLERRSNDRPHVFEYINLECSSSPRKHTHLNQIDSIDSKADFVLKHRIISLNFPTQCNGSPKIIGYRGR